MAGRRLHTSAECTCWKQLLAKEARIRQGPLEAQFRAYETMKLRRSRRSDSLSALPDYNLPTSVYNPDMIGLIPDSRRMKYLRQAFPGPPPRDEPPSWMPRPSSAPSLRPDFPEADPAPPAEDEPAPARPQSASGTRPTAAERARRPRPSSAPTRRFTRSMKPASGELMAVPTSFSEIERPRSAAAARARAGASKGTAVQHFLDQTYGFGDQNPYEAVDEDPERLLRFGVSGHQMGIEKIGEGRTGYLKVRQRLDPAQKTMRPETSAQVVGWNAQLPVSGPIDRATLARKLEYGMKRTDLISVQAR